MSNERDGGKMPTGTTDYYEFLQISPNADADTVHRVYKFLAARLHPDNIETGHAENFRLLKAAYDVLSDPQRRAEYDASRAQGAPQPYSASIDFMDKLDGELNRRLAVLAVLYYQRRTTPNLPEVTLAAIEERMGFPRDYLDFTLWYLHKKGYIAKADNAQYTLTAEGVDFVELQRVNLPILNRLLTSGSAPVTNHAARTSHEPVSEPASERISEPITGVPADAKMNGGQSAAATPKRVVLPATTDRYSDRRAGKTERRVGAPDLRTKKLERRFHVIDRRVDITDQQAGD